MDQPTSVRVAGEAAAGAVHDGRRSAALLSLLEATDALPPQELYRISELVAGLLEASAARIYIADYALVCLQEFGFDELRPHVPIEGTLAGRAYANGEILVVDGDPTVVWVPLTDVSERLGVLELTVDTWHDELHALLDPIVKILVLELVRKRRYTDIVLRSRRAQPLSPAAELQWGLLPPLACSTEQVAVSGILEPAYSVGGDSFDYAFNPGVLELAIIDAVGHGMPSVLLAAVATNVLRNVRREGGDLTAAYVATGEELAEQFTRPMFSPFVTGQLGTLELDTGHLRWLNAGHPLPLLVRDGSFVGELPCAPSLPMGLGGTVTEIATAALQPGDRVLFYTDGVIECRSPEGEAFGTERLADFLVRATLDGVSPTETLRRLNGSILAYNGAGLSDDATLLLLEYQPPRP